MLIESPVSTGPSNFILANEIFPLEIELDMKK